MLPSYILNCGLALGGKSNHNSTLLFDLLTGRKINKDLLYVKLHLVFVGMQSSASVHMTGLHVPQLESVKVMRKMWSNDLLG